MVCGSADAQPCLALYPCPFHMTNERVCPAEHLLASSGQLLSQLSSKQLRYQLLPALCSVAQHLCSIVMCGKHTQGGRRQVWEDSLAAAASAGGYL